MGRLSGGPVRLSTYLAVPTHATQETTWRWNTVWQLSTGRIDLKTERNFSASQNLWGTESSSTEIIQCRLRVLIKIPRILRVVQYSPRLCCSCGPWKEQSEEDTTPWKQKIFVFTLLLKIENRDLMCTGRSSSSQCKLAFMRSATSSDKFVNLFEISKSMWDHVSVLCSHTIPSLWLYYLSGSLFGYIHKWGGGLVLVHNTSCLSCFTWSRIPNTSCLSLYKG